MDAHAHSCPNRAFASYMLTLAHSDGTTFANRFGTLLAVSEELLRATRADSAEDALALAACERREMCTTTEQVDSLFPRYMANPTIENSRRFHALTLAMGMTWPYGDFMVHFYANGALQLAKRAASQASPKATWNGTQYEAKRAVIAEKRAAGETLTMTEIRVLLSYTYFRSFDDYLTDLVGHASTRWAYTERGRDFLDDNAHKFARAALKDHAYVNHPARALTGEPRLDLTSLPILDPRTAMQDGTNAHSHGDLSADAATALLLPPGIDGASRNGSYLFRAYEGSANVFVLSVVVGGEVESMKVERDESSGQFFFTATSTSTRATDLEGVATFCRAASPRYRGLVLTRPILRQELVSARTELGSAKTIHNTISLLNDDRLRPFLVDSAIAVYDFLPAIEANESPDSRRMIQWSILKAHFEEWDTLSRDMGMVAASKLIDMLQTIKERAVARDPGAEIEVVVACVSMIPWDPTSGSKFKGRMYDEFRGTGLPDNVHLFGRRIPHMSGGSTRALPRSPAHEATMNKLGYREGTGQTQLELSVLAFKDVLASAAAESNRLEQEGKTVVHFNLAVLAVAVAADA